MAARLMNQQGFKIIAIIEYDIAAYNPAGLNIDALMKHRAETGSVRDFRGGENMDRHEAMFLECELLLPAATENVITSENADRLRCKILCEGANGPTTSVADQILMDKRIFRQGFFWNEDLVNERLREIMVNSFAAVVAYAGKHQVNNRTAAYMLALDRVATVIRLRGLYA